MDAISLSAALFRCKVKSQFTYKGAIFTTLHSCPSLLACLLSTGNKKRMTYSVTFSVTHSMATSEWPSLAALLAWRSKKNTLLYYFN